MSSCSKAKPFFAFCNTEYSVFGFGGGFMFKGLKGGGGDDSQANPQSSGSDNTDVLQELAEFRAKVDRVN